jgi:glycine/D-amino acid oxidase-like deaminating enzyme
MGKVNCLIVGQGIAGSLISYMLHRKNISFVVMDPGLQLTASRVAAGMFTPVSGKRKTILPITLQQIPFAIHTYQKIAKILGKELLHLQNVYNVFTSETERLALTGKMVKEPYRDYLVDNPSPIANLHQEFGAIEISASGWVDCPLFVDEWRKWLEESSCLLPASFDYSKLEVTVNGIAYMGTRFDCVIFCEGYRGMNNPYFPGEVIVPCKGEVLTIKTDHLPPSHIIKQSGIYLVPLGGKTFKAGATYRWHDQSEAPDETGREEIEVVLHKLLQHNYQVIEHRTGIRPTTKTREVIIAQHAVHKNVYMLNGLGTKGVLLGPWFANELVEKYF